ncbi:MAG: hypothetical protein WC859_10515 [Elusimicrobiota bacterium]|jgi:hypothetical protein
MSAVHPRRTADEVRASIVDAAESCELALTHEAHCVAVGDFLNAALMADVAEWDAIRSFAMSERFA